MTDREQKALDAILSAKNCRDICPDTVRRVFMETLPKYKSLKDADKAARDRLHQITGAFMTADEIGRAEKRIAESGADALEELWKLHSSTRERLDSWRELYTHVFSVTGTVRSANDLACGLNPLCLGAMGLSCTGMDIYAGAVNLVNEWAKNEQWPVSCMLVDLLGDVTFPQADTALMMKLLPVLETNEKGSAMKLLSDLILERHHRHFPRCRETQLRKDHIHLKRFIPLRLISIANLIVSQLQIHRAPRLTRITHLD